MTTDTLTITKEQLRRAVITGWSECIPIYHMDLDQTWNALQSGHTPKGTDEHDPLGEGDKGYQYALDSHECWGSDAE